MNIQLLKQRASQIKKQNINEVIEQLTLLYPEYQSYNSQVLEKYIYQMRQEKLSISQLSQVTNLSNSVEARDTLSHKQLFKIGKLSKSPTFQKWTMMLTYNLVINETLQIQLQINSRKDCQMRKEGSKKFILQKLVQNANSLSNQQNNLILQFQSKTVGIFNCLLSVQQDNTNSELNITIHNTDSKQNEALRPSSLPTAKIPIKQEFQEKIVQHTEPQYKIEIPLPINQNIKNLNYSQPNSAMRSMLSDISVNSNVNVSANFDEFKHLLNKKELNNLDEEKLLAQQQLHLKQQQQDDEIKKKQNQLLTQLKQNEINGIQKQQLKYDKQKMEIDFQMLEDVLLESEFKDILLDTCSQNNSQQSVEELEQSIIQNNKIIEKQRKYPKISQQEMRLKFEQFKNEFEQQKNTQNKFSSQNAYNNSIADSAIITDMSKRYDQSQNSLICSSIQQDSKLKSEIKSIDDESQTLLKSQNDQQQRLEVSQKLEINSNGGKTGDQKKKSQTKCQDNSLLQKQQNDDGQSKLQIQQQKTSQKQITNNKYEQGQHNLCKQDKQEHNSNQPVKQQLKIQKKQPDQQKQNMTDFEQLDTEYKNTQTITQQKQQQITKTNNSLQQFGHIQEMKLQWMNSAQEYNNKYASLASKQIKTDTTQLLQMIMNEDYGSYQKQLNQLLILKKSGIK